MDTQSSTPPVDVDDLAREKVQEVEEILDRPENLKLESIKSCFAILKQIITAADLHRTNQEKDKSENNEQIKTENSESIYADYADDHEQFNAVDLSEQFATNSVKWTIRVRAFKSVHRIFELLISTKFGSNKSTVLKILPDLIRLSFVAATSPYDNLKIQGFQMFRDLINRFALVEEKEFPGHSILEQYKTQLLSAVKPAFELDAPPYITAIACQVCSQWICRGLEKESVGLKRAYQLMEPSIEKLESQSINPNSLLYQEIELEQERLDILGSWAQLYITSHEASETSKLLKYLIENRVETLVVKWWEALKDYALLIMLSPKRLTVSHDNEHVYTREVAFKLFTPIWPKLTLAVTIWLCSSKRKTSESEDPDKTTFTNTKANGSQKYFRFLCGILLNEFCKCLQSDLATMDSIPEPTMLALRSLNMLLSSVDLNKNFLDDIMVTREFYTALRGLLLKLTNPKNAHRLLLKNTLLQLFDLMFTNFKDNDKIVQYSLAQFICSILTSIEPYDTAASNELERTSQQLIVANLFVVAKSRTDILAGDCKLLDAFTDVIGRILTCDRSDTSTLTIVTVIDGVHNLLKNLPKTAAETVIKRVSVAKQSLLSRLLDIHSIIDKSSPVQKSCEPRILFEVVAKSMKADLAHLSVPIGARQELLSGLLKTLLTIVDSLKHDKDSCDQITLILRDLEKNFAEDFAALRQASDSMRCMIDNALKQPATKVDALPGDSTKTTKKTANSVVKKPSSRIVLKSDFSNFYSKKQ